MVCLTDLVYEANHRLPPVKQQLCKQIHVSHVTVIDIFSDRRCYIINLDQRRRVKSPGVLQVSSYKSHTINFKGIGCLSTWSPQAEGWVFESQSRQTQVV